MSFDLTLFAKTAERIRERALEEERLIDNPSDEVLRSIVEREPEVKKTIYENLVAYSEPTSRAANFTENSVDHPFGEEELKLLKLCEEVLAKERLISVDRVVGDKLSGTTVRLTVPEKFAHVAYGGKNLFAPIKEKIERPTYEMIMFADDAFEANKSKPLSQKDIAIRLAMLDDGRVIKIIRNSNYIGEYKKGVFAAEDWSAKRRGGIFLHAGCRDDRIQSAHGDYKNVRSLFVALTANGKTTTTCKILARKEGEVSWLIQDDGGTLMPDGSFHGFEGGGIYAKTESVDVEIQTEIFYGLLSQNTLCENVYVTEEGEMDFFNFERTSNGRAVICRRDFMHAGVNISVDGINNIVLITRGAIIPAVSKLTLEQATALMVLGQSMESSSGDPENVGKIRSVFFYDPFAAGDRDEHANRFYNILKKFPNINYYLLNTGGMGRGYRYKDITLSHTMSILDSLLRGGLEDWIDSSTGFKIPKSVRNVDDIYFHPEKLYPVSEFEEKQNKLNEIRRKTIERIEGLHPDIKNVFSKE